MIAFSWNHTYIHTHTHTHTTCFSGLTSLLAIPVVTATSYDEQTTDRDVGKPVLVSTGSGRSVVLSAVVTADPCPSVQWRMNGTNIRANDVYQMINPCPDSSAGSPSYYFVLIITTTSATAGTYNAIFSNPAGTTSMPDVFVTPPGMLAVKSMYSRWS